MRKKILVIGGSGVFGTRVAGLLSRVRVVDGMDVTIAARNLGNLEKASTEIASGRLVGEARKPSIVQLDITDMTQLRDVIRDEKPSVVINAAGTFFDTSYDVPRLCVQEKTNYVDLADNRLYVTQFSKELDTEAKKAGVTLLTAASTTLALSSAIVDKFHEILSSSPLKHVDIAMSPGNRLPRFVHFLSLSLSLSPHTNALNSQRTRHDCICAFSFRPKI